MNNLIAIPKFIPNNVTMTPYISPTLSNTGHTNVLTTPNTAGQTWNTNIVKINSAADTEGGIEFHFENLEIGDFIEISCEMRVVSGDMPILKIAEFNKTTRVESYPSQRQVQRIGEWHAVTLKCPLLIYQGSMNHRAFIGLATGKAGIFEVRGVRAIAYSKTTAPKPEKKDYVARITKVGGVLQIQSVNSDAGITLTKPYPYLFQLTYPRTTSRPIIIFQNNKAKQYIVEASDANETTASFSFATIAGASVGDIDATLPTDIMLGVYIKWI